MCEIPVITSGQCFEVVTASRRLMHRGEECLVVMNASRWSLHCDGQCIGGGHCSAGGQCIAVVTSSNVTTLGWSVYRGGQCIAVVNASGWSLHCGGHYIRDGPCVKVVTALRWSMQRGCHAIAVVNASIEKMATRFLRSLLTTTKQSVIPSFLRSPASVRASFLRRLWPFTAAANNNSPQALSSDTGVPGFSKSSPSLFLSYDPPPKKSIRIFTQEEADLIEGCDFEHWVVITVPPSYNRKLTRDEVIDYYIKTLAKVVGSEEEARKKMYSVFTNQPSHAFGAHVSEELANKLNDLDNVFHVLPDFYRDVTNKRYPGEPFINGQAVPYHPKYREEYLRSIREGNVLKRCYDQSLNTDNMPPNCMSRSPNVPPNNCDGGVQPGYASEPGNAPTLQNGNVPMNNVSA